MPANPRRYRVSCCWLWLQFHKRSGQFISNKNVLFLYSIIAGGRREVASDPRYGIWKTEKEFGHWPEFNVISGFDDLIFQTEVTSYRKYITVRLFGSHRVYLCEKTCFTWYRDGRSGWSTALLMFPQFRENLRCTKPPLLTYYPSLARLVSSQ